MSPFLPERSRLLNQPSSTGWFDLPLEMQEMVIDRMDPKTRCKFAQCSKWCEYEAKKSKNYLYKIGITEDMDNSYELQLHLSHTDEYEKDYLFEFVNSENNQTIVSYKCHTNLGKVVKWTKMETGEPKDVRLKYFNDYVEKYNHSIREFHFSGMRTSVVDFNITNLRNLERLQISGVHSQDLRGLDLVECGFIELEQLIRLRSIFAPTMKLTFEQITELKCDTIHVASTDFSEENTNKYLKMIKRGEIHENTKSIDIYFILENTIRNVQKVMNGLDIFNSSEEEDNVGDEQEIELTEPTCTFNFLSDVKKNGMFRVYFTPQVSIGIYWI